jgi:hypothetical protein
VYLVLFCVVITRIIIIMDFNIFSKNLHKMNYHLVIFVTFKPNNHVHGIFCVNALIFGVMLHIGMKIYC